MNSLQRWTRNILTLHTCIVFHGLLETFETPAEKTIFAGAYLLISDVVMPGLSGVDLGIQIKAQSPECKILLFSGQANNKDLLKDARGQGNTFQLLQKPVHSSVVLSSIGALATESSLDGRGSVQVPSLPYRRRRDVSCAKESSRAGSEWSVRRPGGGFRCQLCFVTGL